jgi:hypothetical protein
MTPKRTKTMQAPAPAEVIFNGKMADGSTAPTFKAWMAERRKLGLPTGKRIHVTGLAGEVLTVKGGNVMLG